MNINEFDENSSDEIEIEDELECQLCGSTLIFDEIANEFYCPLCNDFNEFDEE